MNQTPGGTSRSYASADNGDSVSADDMRRAKQMARELVVGPKGSPSDHAVRLSAPEKAKVRALVHCLVTPPMDARHDIKNLADIIDIIGATSGAETMGLWNEFRSLARKYPQEFIEECGGDLAQQARETLVERAFPQCRVAQEGLAVKLRVLRDELAGPKPSAVEWHLADATALAWADYHRCVIDRENLTGRDDWRVWSYHDQRLDRAHRRFIRSMKALAAVRKLDLTAIQININDVVDELPAGAAASGHGTCGGRASVYGAHGTSLSSGTIDLAQRLRSQP